MSRRNPLLKRAIHAMRMGSIEVVLPAEQPTAFEGLFHKKEGALLTSSLAGGWIGGKALGICEVSSR